MRGKLLGFGLLAVSTATLSHAQTRPETSAVLAGSGAQSDVAPMSAQAVPIGLPETSATSANMALNESGTMIGAVNIEGASTIAVADFGPIVERFIGQSASTESLQSLAHSIAERARQRGFIFASAMVPEQQINMGIVRVRLDEGSVNQVRILGSSNRQLHRILNSIVGTTAEKSLVERQLLLAADIPGIRILRTRFAREHGKGVLIVEVAEDWAKGQLWVDTFGSKAYGPIRARVQTDLTSLFIAGDSLSTQMIITPIDPRKMAYASGRYAMPVGIDGATVALTIGAGRTRSVDEDSGTPIHGRSLYSAVSATYPVLRSNDKSLWVGGEIARLTVDQSALGAMIQSDTIVTASISLNGQMKLAGGRLSGGIGVVQGLGGTGELDPLASRYDGSSRFTKSYAWAQWTGGLGGKYSMRISAMGQIASRPLLAAQELGLGGPGFGRGYDFSERFGDGGVLGLVELRRDFDKPLPMVKWAQLYGFVDGGYIYNLQGGFGGGTLVSAGGGMRAGIGATEVSFEAALPINAIRQDSDNKSPRVNLAVGYHF
jgi:hemolysin activation/secretion protein